MTVAGIRVGPGRLALPGAGHARARPAYLWSVLLADQERWPAARGRGREAEPADVVAVEEVARG